MSRQGAQKMKQKLEPQLSPIDAGGIQSQSPRIHTSKAAGQSILLAIAEIGRGTEVSFTVIFMVSESEQYFTPDTTIPLGRQSEASSKVMSWPALVKDFPVQVNASIPSPKKST